jgi:uncharacterized protein
MPSVSALYIYPIKSCAAVEVKHATCTTAGFKHDREWAIIDARGHILTQRDTRALVFIRPSVGDSGELTMEADGLPPLLVSPPKSASKLDLEVWGRPAAAVDQGDEAAQWLTRVLQSHCRLVRWQADTKGLSFTDCSPVLLTSEASLADLNQRLTEPVSMDRFRPSIVISGVDAYAEDSTRSFASVEVTFKAESQCARCVVVNIDQLNGSLLGDEPLHTLSTYRRIGQKVMFGHYFSPDGSGTIRVGESLTWER